MAESWGAPWEELTPTERHLYWLLGLGASWIWNNKKSSLILGYIWYRNPGLGFKLIRTATVESVRYSARLGWGITKDIAPEASKKVESGVRRVRQYVNPIPDWARTGSKFAKGSFATLIIATGIGMIDLQYERANRGDKGHSMSQFITDADMNMPGQKGYHEDMRPVRLHSPGGRGIII